MANQDCGRAADAAFAGAGLNNGAGLEGRPGAPAGAGALATPAAPAMTDRLTVKLVSFPGAAMAADRTDTLLRVKPSSMVLPTR